MRLRRITRELRKYDDQLYAGLADNGTPCVFRKRQSVVRHEFDGCIIFQVVNRPDLVFPITDTWLMDGTVVDWGLEPLMEKVRSCDQQNRDIFDEINKHNDRVDESQKRNFSNKIESWAHDFRSAFAKETNDINTSMIKSDLEIEKRKENSLWQ